MRDNFWKWLKRFFVVLPVLMMLLQFVIFMGNYWRDNATSSFIIGDTGFIHQFVGNGGWINNGINSPLLIEIDSLNGVYNTIQMSFVRLFAFLTGNSNFSSFIDGMISFPEEYSYFIILINFLTWWVFVDLFFLFFRFVTFLISWINSLFDNTFKKIKK